MRPEPAPKARFRRLAAAIGRNHRCNDKNQALDHTVTGLLEVSLTCRLINSVLVFALSNTCGPNQFLRHGPENKSGIGLKRQGCPALPLLTRKQIQYRLRYANR